MSNLTTRVGALESTVNGMQSDVSEIKAMLAAFVGAQEPARTVTPAKAEPQPKADLKPLSKGEIKRLRASGASWVKGLADWQLQGRKPAGAVATGKVVPASVLAKHGYSRPTGALKAAIKAA